MLCSSAVQAIHLRKHWCLFLAFLICGMAIPSLIVGAHLVFALPAPAVKFFLGLLFGGLAIVKIRKGATSRPPPPLELWGEAAPHSLGSTLPTTNSSAFSSASASAPLLLSLLPSKPDESSNTGGGSWSHSSSSSGSSRSHCSVKHTFYVAAAALASGLLKGLCGVGGPPMMALLAFGVSVDQTAWRATGALVQVVCGAVQT